MADLKQRLGLVGTGHRGSGTWGMDLMASFRDRVEFVGLCDSNPRRLSYAQRAIGTNAPAFTDFGEMIRETRPERVIVCSRDDTHVDFIVQALEAGIDVITEKPMATTAEACRRILEVERRTGRRVDVAFNYRYAPMSAKLKELILSGEIGDVTSVDFHWYLDTQHGADYFRRWHAYRRHSGTLFVHKATHHFDLLNWYLGSDPEEIFARGQLVHYGRNNSYRGVRCKTCQYADICPYHIDIGDDPRLEALYEGPSEEDGYFRDACVFREDIDIYDTMTAAILYESGVQVSYSLNTYMPIEGHHLAFNGHKGRIEVRHYERQPWPSPEHVEILLMRNFRKEERIHVSHGEGGHFGGDPLLAKMLFEPGRPDPLGQRAGARAGAMSVLCGVAAAMSADSGKTERIKPLLEGR